MVPDPELRRLLHLCEERLNSDPHDPDALFAKAAVYGHLGLYADALEFLQVVSAKESGYPGLERFRRRIVKEMGQTIAFQTSFGDGPGWHGGLEI